MTGLDQPYYNSHKANTQTLGARICTKKSRFKTSRLQTKVDVDQLEAERENKQPGGSTGNPVALEANKRGTYRCSLSALL